MPQKDPTLINEASPLSWNIEVQSVHIVAYKLWIQQPQSDTWEVISQGKNTDTIPDTGEFPVKTGMKFSFWFGIGSTTPNTAYTIKVALRQDNQPIENGVMEVTGSVNDEGVARVLEIVTFQS